MLHNYFFHPGVYATNTQMNLFYIICYFIANSKGSQANMKSTLRTLIYMYHFPRYRGNVVTALHSIKHSKYAYLDVIMNINFGAIYHMLSCLSCVPSFLVILGMEELSSVNVILELCIIDQFEFPTR